MKDITPAPTAQRERLPNRRICISRKVLIETGGAPHTVHISLGYNHQDPQVREVFYASGQKEGSARHNEAHDACVLISMLLQYGATPSEICKTLATVEHDGETKPVSVAGAIARAIEADSAK